MHAVTRRALSLGSLRTFEAVARLLSFSDAAEELFVTQSAVSRQIKGLEDELGAALFVRGTRHVEMTQSGQVTPAQRRPGPRPSSGRPATRASPVRSQAYAGQGGRRPRRPR